MHPSRYHLNFTTTFSCKAQLDGRLEEVFMKVQNDRQQFFISSYLKNINEGQEEMDLDCLDESEDKFMIKSILSDFHLTLLLCCSFSLCKHKCIL